MGRVFKLYHVYIAGTIRMVQVLVYPHKKYALLFTDEDTINRFKAFGFKVDEDGKQWYILDGNIDVLEADQIWKQVEQQWNKPLFEGSIQLPE